MVGRDRVGTRSGGADGLMLIVDASRFRPRRTRRLLIWSLVAFVLLVGLLLGLLVPQSPVPIEIWTGAGVALHGW